MRRLAALAAAPFVALFLAACTSGSTPPAPTASPTTPRQTLTAPASPSPAPTSTWPSTSACGFERWPVKTGTDPMAGQVNLADVIPATVAQLGALTAPDPSTLPQDSRITPTETTVYQVHATLTGYKMESDSDYHLILNQVLPNGQVASMIAEIPDPACVPGYPSLSASPFLAGIEQARTAFDARFPGVGPSFGTTSTTVTVTGVGFFDRPHGQSGIAPNAIELHPVLSITFGATLGAALHKCYPTTLAGECYTPGQHCQDDFTGMTGTGPGGLAITCRRGAWRLAAKA